MPNEQVTVISLTSAYLCLDCDTISNLPDCCPRCASGHNSMMPLAPVLGLLAGTPVEFKRLYSREDERNNYVGTIGPTVKIIP